MIIEKERAITIAELRARANKMTQKKLAKELGVAQSTVSSWERDITTIHAKDLVNLCNYFNVSADDLLGLKF